VAEKNIGILTAKTAPDLYFGYRASDPGKGIRFVGAMDDVGLFNRALSPAELQAIYDAGSGGKAASLSGLVGLWRLDGDASDALGANPGQLFGSPSFVPGKAGQALVFDGTNTYVKIPASASLNVGLSTGLTIDAWISPDDILTQRPIVEWDDGISSYDGAHFWLSVPPWGGPGSMYATLDVSQLIASPNVLSTSGFAAQYIYTTLTVDTNLPTMPIKLGITTLATHTLISPVPVSTNHLQAA